MPVTVAGSEVIGAVESRTNDDVDTVIAALLVLSAPVHEPIRACTEYFHVPTGTLCSTQLVVVTVTHASRMVWATFEES